MMTLVKIAVISILSLITLEAEAQELYTLTINIEEAESNDGKMFVSMYNKEADFLGTSYKGTISKIVNNGCVVTFKDIPKGTYAVSIFHDENDNGQLDSNFMGIPKEDYGCSNDARGFMGPPKWNDAKFNIEANTSIKITL